MNESLYPPFTNEKTGTERLKMICLKSPSLWVLELAFKPKQSGFMSMQLVPVTTSMLTHWVGSWMCEYKTWEWSGLEKHLYFWRERLFVPHLSFGWQWGCANWSFITWFCSCSQYSMSPFHEIPQGEVCTSVTSLPLVPNPMPAR